MMMWRSACPYEEAADGACGSGRFRFGFKGKEAGLLLVGRLYACADVHMLGYVHCAGVYGCG